HRPRRLLRSSAGTSRPIRMRRRCSHALSQRATRASDGGAWLWLSAAPEPATCSPSIPVFSLPRSVPSLPPEISPAAFLRLHLRRKTMSIQSLREERAHPAKTLRNLVDQHPGDQWQDAQQQQYDRLVADIDRLDAQIARQQKAYDLDAQNR